MSPKSDIQVRKTRQLPIAGGAGIVTIAMTDGGITAESSAGLTVELSETTAFDDWPLRADRAKVLAEKLAKGIEIHNNGVLVGHLSQTRRGWRRRSRILELNGVDPHRFPPGTHMRHRGFWGYTSLETPSQRLASCRRSGLRRKVQLRARDANEESIVILGAVHSGLSKPMASRPWFQLGIESLIYIMMFLAAVATAIKLLADWF